MQVYLSQFLKELDPRHVETLIQSEGAGNPLYLKVVLSELRVFGAFADLGEKIRADFGTDPVAAFGGVLRRLENDPTYAPVQPELLVPRVFGWLAHARQGLSVEELSALLIQEGLLPDDADGRHKAEKAIYGLLRQVRPYLARREGRADFFYESFKLAVLERYVRDTGKVGVQDESRSAPAWHASLAAYFDEQPLRLGAERTLNRHKLAEIAYQFTWAGLADQLMQTLWDYRFIVARLEGFDIRALIGDYDLADVPTVRVNPEAARILDLLQSALRLSAHVLASDPTQLPSQLHGRLLGFDNSPVRALLAQAQCETQRPWLRPLTPTLDVPGDALVRTLVGHTDHVTAVALTPDGRLAVSASWDNTLKVWDVASGQELHTLAGHTKPVIAVALTPDGRLAVSVSWDNTLKVWDVASGQELRTLAKEKSWSSTAVALTPDGRLFVSVSGNTVKVWEVANGQELRTLTVPTNPLTHAQLTPDGRLAVFTSWGNSLTVWDVASGMELRSLANHLLTYIIALTADGRLAVSTPNNTPGDTTLKVWDLTSGTASHSLAGHSRDVNAVALTPDGRLAVSASADRDPQSVGREERARAAHPDWPYRQCHSCGAHAGWPDGRLRIVGQHAQGLGHFD